MNNKFRMCYQYSAVALLTLTTFGFTGCSTANSNTSGNTSDSTGHILSATQVKMIDDAINAESTGGHNVILAGPRPSSQHNANNQMTMMNIRDEDTSKWEKGTYQLQVFCIGDGSLKVSFTAGDKTDTIPNMACSKDVTSQKIALEIEESENSVVSIEPSDDAKIEIAYRIDKL